MEGEGDNGWGSPPLSPRVSRRPKAKKPSPPSEPRPKSVPRRRAPRSVANGSTPPKAQEPVDEEEEEQNDEQVLAETLATSEIVVVKDATRDLVYLLIAILATIALVVALLVEMQARGGLVEMSVLCVVAVIGVMAWCAVIGISDRDHNAWKQGIAIAGLACLIVAVVVLVVENVILPVRWPSDGGTGQSNVSAVVKNVTDLASKK